MSFMQVRGVERGSQGSSWDARSTLPLGFRQHLDGREIPMSASINVVVTPSHRITNVNRFADQETKQVPNPAYLHERHIVCRCCNIW